MSIKNNPQGVDDFFNTNLANGWGFSVNITYGDIQPPNMANVFKVDVPGILSKIPLCWDFIEWPGDRDFELLRYLKPYFEVKLEGPDPPTKAIIKVGYSDFNKEKLRLFTELNKLSMVDNSIVRERYHKYTDDPKGLSILRKIFADTKKSPIFKRVQDNLLAIFKDVDISPEPLADESPIQLMPGCQKSPESQHTDKKTKR